MNVCVSFNKLNLLFSNYKLVHFCVVIFKLLPIRKPFIKDLFGFAPYIAVGVLDHLVKQLVHSTFFFQRLHGIFYFTEVLDEL